MRQRNLQNSIRGRYSGTQWYTVAGPLTVDTIGVIPTKSGFVLSSTVKVPDPWQAPGGQTILRQSADQRNDSPDFYFGGRPAGTMRFFINTLIR